MAVYQQHFLIRTDNTAADGGTPVWQQAVDVNGTMPVATPFRIRFVLRADTSFTGYLYKIRASRNGGSYFDVTPTSTFIQATDATAGASADNSPITTSLIGGTGTFTNGEYDLNGITAAQTINSGQFTENEYGLQILATSAVGDTFDFVVMRGATAVTATVTPRITVAAAAVNYSLAATSGAFNESGHAVKAGFGLLATSGAFALSGQLAGLTTNVKTNYALAAASGAFARSGQLAQTSRAFLLQGTTRQLNISGNQVTVGFGLPEDPGQFLRVSNDVVLVVAGRVYQLIGNTGVFLLAGGASTFSIHVSVGLIQPFTLVLVAELPSILNQIINALNYNLMLLGFAPSQLLPTFTEIAPSELNEALNMVVNAMNNAEKQLGIFPAKRIPLFMGVTAPLLTLAVNQLIEDLNAVIALYL